MFGNGRYLDPRFWTQDMLGDALCACSDEELKHQGYEFYPQITDEWARQIALGAFGDNLDFKTMRIIAINLESPHIRAADGEWNEIKILMKLFYDAINLEIHKVGYSKEINTMLYFQPKGKRG